MVVRDGHGHLVLVLVDPVLVVVLDLSGQLIDRLLASIKRIRLGHPVLQSGQLDQRSGLAGAVSFGASGLVEVATAVDGEWRVDAGGILEVGRNGMSFQNAHKHGGVAQVANVVAFAQSGLDGGGDSLGLLGGQGDAVFARQAQLLLDGIAPVSL